MQDMSSSAAQVMAEVNATDWSRFSIPAENYLWDYAASRVVPAFERLLEDGLRHGSAVRLTMSGMDAGAKSELIDRLVGWRDGDGPLVEPVGDALAQVHRLDSQEQARRIVSTLIEVLEREL